MEGIAQVRVKWWESIEMQNNSVWLKREKGFEWRPGKKIFFALLISLKINPNSQHRNLLFWKEA